MLVRDGLHVKLYNVAAFKKNIILLFLKKKYWRKCRLDQLLCFSAIKIVSAGIWTQQVVLGFVHIQSYTFVCTHPSYLAPFKSDKESAVKIFVHKIKSIKERVMSVAGNMSKEGNIKDWLIRTPHANMVD